MFEKFKNWRAKNRLFRDKQTMQHHINQSSLKDRDLYISYVHAIKRHIISGNKEEVKNRQKWLANYNLVPPKTEKECDQMIKDLRSFRA